MDDDRQRRGEHLHLVGLGRQCRSLGPGPITVPNRHAYSVLAHHGDEVTDGGEVLHLRGHRTAVIDHISLVGAKGLKFLGAKLAPPRRPIGAVVYMPTWPPRDPLLPRDILRKAAGTRITSADGDWELLVGMRVTGRGRASRVGIRVDYSSGGRKYTVELPAGAMLCLSAKAHRTNTCHVPDRLT